MTLLHMLFILQTVAYNITIKTNTLFANFRPRGFIEQKENDNNVIVIVFFLLDKGHEAENLQKECLFYCITTSLWRTPVNHIT